MATIKAGTCQSEVILSNVNPGEANTVIYYAPFPTTLITGAISILPTDTAFDINFKLANDPIRILSGFTITVITFDGTGLTVKIVKSNSGSTPSTATGFSPTADQLNTAPFVCRRRKPISGGGVVVDRSRKCYRLIPSYTGADGLIVPSHYVQVSCNAPNVSERSGTSTKVCVCCTNYSVTLGRCTEWSRCPCAD